MSPEAAAVLYIAAAALGGAAVGVEREWSGHASGPHARFAGIRTFTLLGGLAGIAGWLWNEGAAAMATVLLAGGAALVVTAYVAASRHAVDGTTEVAALVVLAAGALAGAGRLTLASGIVAVTSLLLVEKTRLHAWVARIDDAGLRAGFRFAVMAVVVLPLLPEGPYGPFGGVRPRELWALVLVFAGLSFAGYVARRAVGARRGYSVAGLLGGVISSTSVSFVFARASARAEAPGLALACGVVAASAVMFLRVLVATAILAWPLALVLAPYALVPFAAGALVALTLLRRTPEPAGMLTPPANPLQVWSALQMAALFQAALAVITVVHARFGELGVLWSGAVLGATDVDALTFSMVLAVAGGAPLALVARALGFGMLANTLLKLAVTLGLGHGRFRVAAALGLTVMALAAGATLAVPIFGIR
jgi:uncharacterized membrane protein (DUF4010 family)